MCSAQVSRGYTLDQMPQSIGIEATVPTHGKQRGIGIFPVFPFC
jgi:hypothetical protein